MPDDRKFPSDDSKSFPDELNGAKVLFYAIIGDHDSNGYYCLAIGKYDNSNGCYLFGCNKDCEAENSTFWDSVEECMAVVKSSYGKGIRWIEKSSRDKKKTIGPCPIRDYIVYHLKNGCFPNDFRIPWIKSVWAPGAEDGVALYHMVSLAPDEERAGMILKAIKILADPDKPVQTEEALSIFEKLDKKISVARLYDEIVQTIVRNRESLNLVKLLASGIELAMKGSSLLPVKLGMTIISRFKVPEIVNVMIPLGTYDEFTYFAARALSGTTFSNGNQSLFNLAKNTYGWGRIHAVKYLRPETQEIRDWLLYEGAENRIDPQYSADICLKKADALNRLMDTEEITEKEYKAIGTLISYTLRGGPHPGISGNNAGLIAFYYLVNSQKYHADGDLVQAVSRFLEEKTR